MSRKIEDVTKTFQPEILKATVVRRHVNDETCQAMVLCALAESIPPSSQYRCVSVCGLYRFGICRTPSLDRLIRLFAAYHIRSSHLSAPLLRYTQSLITQMAQPAVCNRYHSVDQQLCRWLLLSLDRLNGPDLHMTQELIANMLGVRQEGVTEAAGKLQIRGLSATSVAR